MNGYCILDARWRGMIAPWLLMIYTVAASVAGFSVSVLQALMCRTRFLTHHNESEKRASSGEERPRHLLARTASSALRTNLRKHSGRGRRRGQPSQFHQIRPSLALVTLICLSEQRSIATVNVLNGIPGRQGSHPKNIWRSGVCFV